jgi:adenylyl-sulfate kinase
VLNALQHKVLRRIAPGEPNHLSGEAYIGRSKLRCLFGEDLFKQVKGKVVIDLGCEEGHEAIELARNGARKVIGLDVRERMLERARANAGIAGVEPLCHFDRATNEAADVVISVDSFEHVANPSLALRQMCDLLVPGGVLKVSFGPPWYHPYGGHLFSVFPWAHLLFSEAALIQWRSGIRSDGARAFHEVAGGLNQMTLRRFERLIQGEGMRVESMELVPIRKLARFHNRWTREFTTSVLRCELRRPEAACELQRNQARQLRRGFTVFFTGLSGSGKSTIAEELSAQLMEMECRPVTLLDGDIVRKRLSSELGFSREHRDINILRIGFVASEITKHGGITICAVIAPFDAVRRQVRSAVQSHGGFVLVYLSTPLETCESRDPKGLYARARGGLVENFTGISGDYEIPEDADLIVDTREGTPEAAAQQILLYLERRGYLQGRPWSSPREIAARNQPVEVAAR